MGDAVVGRESVGEYLDLLADWYGDVSINQTTVTVPGDGYDRARGRLEAGLVDAYVRVWTDDREAFHRRCEDPFTTGEGRATLEGAVRAAVRESTGVDAVVEDVSRVTIAGIHDGDDPDAPTLYRLFVLFEAEYAGGTLRGVEWDAEPTAVPEFLSEA